MNPYLMHIAVFAAAVLIGSFPTAYLLVKRADGKDLRKEGSGNIGALNAFEVSRSRRLGLTVLAIDLLKGAVPMAVLRLLPGMDFAAFSVALIGLVLGHNYSPWIGFKGGRGLATAAGGALLLNPLLVLLWAVCWSIAFFMSPNVHVGNIAATVLAPVLLAILPDPARWSAVVQHPTHGALILTSAMVCLLIMIRHAGPLRELLAARGHAPGKE